MESPKQEPPSSAPDAFDYRRIRRLVELMDAHGLTEVELRQGEVRIRLCRGPKASERVAAPAALPPSSAPVVAPASSPPLAGHEVLPTEETKKHRYVEITSPMVGTFYAASSPDSEPFVQVGSRIEPDTTVCVIEAMKVFNEIPAEVSGAVVAILVENGEPVEHGRPLFRVDPEG